MQKRKQERSKKKRKKRRRKNRKKQKKEKTIDVKRVAGEWKSWDEEEEATRSEDEAKKLVPEKFHK